jgi:ABC-type bacteriocin/lantibiotic exporter with double-glycine peptidase domain
VLTAYDIRTTQRKVAQLADTNKTTGTSTKGIVSALGHFGLRVVAMNGRTLTDIRRALARGTRVVVCYTEPYLDSGHYAVVAGFQGGKILLLSPDERGTLPLAMPIKEFQKRWKDDVFTHSKRWAAFVTR